MKDKKIKNGTQLYVENYSKMNITVYVILRSFVILTLIRQIFLANWNNVFLCVFTLILFLAPVFIDKKLNVKLPDALQAIILIFIFSAEILGEINEFYISIKHWDTILHTINGFLCAAVGFSLIDILNQKDFFHATMSPLFVALVAFCFSMTIGVMWEFFEYEMDVNLKMDMQKDTIVQEISTVTLDPEGKNVAKKIKDIEKITIYNKNEDDKMVETTINGGFLDIGLHDTMMDLKVNFIGAVVFSILGMLYINKREGYKFIENFIPTMKK